MESIEHHLQVANQQLAAGALEQVESLGRELLLRFPGHVGVLQLLAETARQQGNLASAENLIRKAITIRPEDAKSHCTLGAILSGIGRNTDAIASLHEALRLQPGFPEACALLANTSLDIGRDQDARRYIKKALSRNASLPAAYFNRANNFLVRRHMYAALQDYRLALCLKPDYWQAHVNLGLLLRAEGELEKARKHFGLAYKYRSDSTTVFWYLLDAILALGEIGTVAAMRQKITTVVRQCVTSDNERDFAALMYLAPLLSVSESDIVALQKKMNRLLATDKGYPASPSDHGTSKLSIGYLSPDFGDHPISHVMRRMFSEHNRGRFKIIGYALTARNRPADMAYTTVIQRTCDTYVDLSSMTIEQAASRIAADGTAILVNLSGYMAPQSLAICALRPAPIQVYWLGHGGGLGLSFIDYIIGDAVVTPSGEESHYIEKIARLPECYHCTDTPDISDAPQSRDMYGLRDDTFVFCAFNNSNKINLEVFEAWMNILRRVPNSQLWLSGLGSARVLEENLRAEARQRDINPNRLVFAERIADKSVHFARHRMADLFLDTFAYTAATTALDALWAGLPVLTRPGASFYSRICASMVANAGLTDMICANTEEYENRAVHLATHPEELRNIRARLAENLPLAPLFDVPRFVRHLEVAYEKMWELHRAGTARASFDVAAIPRGGDASRDASQ